MLAIIPARGGSKGLPGKNIRHLVGMPLIAYSIEAAKKVEKIDRIIVSTDSEEIAAISRKYGADVPFLRPPELATDSSKSIDTYKYTLNRLKDEEGIVFDSFMVLQPTSPLRTADDINGALELFENKNADSVVSYCKENHPITWHKYIDEEGRFIDIFNKTAGNRQEEKTSYYPNGAIYIFKSEVIFSDNYYTKNSYAYIMDKKNSIDIDTIDDFRYGEFILKG